VKVHGFRINNYNVDPAQEAGLDSKDKVHIVQLTKGIVKGILLYIYPFPGPLVKELWSCPSGKKYAPTLE
jgi:hypothetical protein